MFCPQCKAEYRTGFTRCSDCDVDLVERLPVEPYRSVLVPSDVPMKRVWFGEDRESCVYVCSRLGAAGIPFNVSQGKRQYFWHLDERYEVFVPSGSYEKARAIAERGSLDFSDSSEDQKIMELPDMGPDAIKRDNRGRSWRTEDATVEVWCEKTEEEPWFEQLKGLTWMIELSLHENRIGTRISVSQDGFRRILVRPEDESEAREIVREIKTGTPPT
jgi:hypothetical protein